MRNTSLWWIVGNRQWIIARGMLEASRRNPTACRQTGFLYLSELPELLGVAEAANYADLCGFDSHRLAELIIKLLNYESWKIICKGWAILCAGYVVWNLHLVGVLRSWTHVRIVLLHDSRSVGLHEKHVERFEKHALNYSAFCGRTINQLNL